MGQISTENRDAHYLAIQAEMPESRRLVFAALLAAEPGGLTRYELADKLNRPVSSICGRVNELEKANVVVETEESRPTPYGGNAVVMRISPALRVVKQQSLF